MTTTGPPFVARHAATGSSPPAHAPFGRTLVFLCLAGVLVVSQLYAVIPLLGEIARSWSTTPSAAGWTVTTFGLGYAVGFLVFGPLADRFDRRGLLVAGLAATAATTAVVAFTSTLAWGSAARALQGLTAATFAPAAFAYVAQHLHPSRRIVSISWLTSFFIASAVLGQLLSQVLAAFGGWRAVFAVSAAGLAGCAVLLAVVLRRDHTTSATSAGAAYRAMARLVTKPVVLLLLGATATVLSTFVAGYSALQLAGPDGLTGDNGALLGLRASALPAMLVVPLAAPLLVRLAPARRVGAALLLAAAVTMSIAMFARGDISVAVLGVLLFPFAFAVAVAAPALIEALGSLAGGARGAAVALYTFTLFVGASLGPLLAGALLRAGPLTGGFASVFTGLAILLIAGAALAFGAHRTISEASA